MVGTDLTFSTAHFLLKDGSLRELWGVEIVMPCRRQEKLKISVVSVCFLCPLLVPDLQTAIPKCLDGIPDGQNPAVFRQ